MAVPVFKSQSNAVATTGACTITPPSGIVDNDALLFFLYITPVGAAFDTAIPSNLSTLRARFDTTTYSVYAYWKRAASEAGNYVFDSTTSTEIRGYACAVSGVRTSGNIVDSIGSWATGTGTSAVAGSITASFNQDLLLFTQMNLAGNAGSTPGGMIEQFDSGIQICTQDITSTGPIGGRTATIASSEWVALSTLLEGPSYPPVGKRIFILP